MAYLERREYLAAVPPVAKSFEVYINQDDVEIIGNGIFITVPKGQLDSVERFLQFNNYRLFFKEWREKDGKRKQIQYARCAK